MPLTCLNPIPPPSPQRGDPELGFATFPSACGGFPGGAVVKHCLPAMQETIRDAGSIPGSGKSPGEGNGYPLWYSCLENPMDRGAWLATVYGVAESDMIEQLTFHVTGFSPVH